MKKQRKNILIDTLPLIWPYILMSGVLLVLFTSGIFAYHRVISKNAAKTAVNRVSDLSDEVFIRITSYRKACNVLAASNAVLTFSQGMEGDANSVQAAVSSVQQVLHNVVSIARFPYNDAEAYFPGCQTIVSINHVYQGEEKCAQQLADHSGNTLPDAIADIKPEHAWTVCYGKENAFLIRQLQDRRKETVYIILEFALKELVPLLQEEGMVLFGDENSLLYKSNTFSETEQLSDLFDQMRQNHQFTYNGEKFAAYRCIFSLLHTDIVIAVSINRIAASTSTFLKIPLLLGTIFLACLFGVFKLMYDRVIVPYRYLAEATWTDSENDNPRNVLTLARSNLLSLKSQQEATEEEKKLLIHLGVGDLLHRVRTVPEDPGWRTASRCLSLAGILPGQHYLIFAFFQADRRGEELAELPEDGVEENLIPALEEILREELFTGRVGVISTLERFSVVIATCQEGDTEEKLKVVADHFAESCQEKLKISVAATQPFIGDGAEDLRRQVRRTMNDINYLYFWQKERIEEPGEEKVEELLSFFKAMRNLVNRLDTHDYTGAKEMFTQIMEENIPQTPQNFQIAKYRIYGMIEMLAAAVSDHSMLKEEFIETLDFEKRLYETDTLSSFRSTAEQIFLELMEISRQCDQGDGTQRKMEAVKAYIDAHYVENSLTATFLAEQFQLSSSYLSREFKRIVGCNLLEYIQRLRIEEVKRLLATCSVKEAAQRSGFWDSQGLVRVFKKYEGITPGEYKKNL